MQNVLLAQCRWKIPFISPFPNLLRSRSETVTQCTQETAKETIILLPPLPPAPWAATGCEAKRRMTFQTKIGGSVFFLAQRLTVKFCPFGWFAQNISFFNRTGVSARGEADKNWNVPRNIRPVWNPLLYVTKEIRDCTLSTRTRACIVLCSFRTMAWGEGWGGGAVPPLPLVFCPQKSKQLRIKVENKNSSPRALKQWCLCSYVKHFLSLNTETSPMGSLDPNPGWFSNTMSYLKSFCPPPSPPASKGLLGNGRSRGVAWRAWASPNF